MPTLLTFALALLSGPPEEEGNLVEYDTTWAIVRFERGQLSDAEMERFSQLLDKGVVDIETYLTGSPPAPGSIRKVRYEVRTDIEISWSYRHTVLLPMERVKNDSAPYLHETTHILFPVRSGSLWFAEGFASFVQSYVAEHLGGYDGYVFSKGGNRNVDTLARRNLASPRGKALLPYVGSGSTPPDLYTDRWGVAAPFYVFCHSFVKFLIETAGLEKIKVLLAAPEMPAAVESTTGRTVGQWKAAWLDSLSGGAPAEAPAPSD